MIASDINECFAVQTCKFLYARLMKPQREQRDHRPQGIVHVVWLLAASKPARLHVVQLVFFKLFTVHSNLNTIFLVLNESGELIKSTVMYLFWIPPRARAPSET